MIKAEARELAEVAAFFDVGDVLERRRRAFQRRSKGIAVEDEPGGQGETKRKEGKMSDQEAAINIARDAYCGERPEDEHEDR